MTTSNSPEAVADPASASAAAPYGTRSRGRNAPRPNYAEDRDIEMEFDVAPAKQAGNKRNSGVGLTTNVVNGSKSDSEKSSPVQPRKTVTNGTANSTPKESIPGTSSFSARPEDVNGTSSARKRKQPASSTPTSSSTTGGNPAKRVFTAAPGDSDGGYFTNMMSFEASGPHLKDGQIKADDGTTLAVNGEPQKFCRGIMAHFPPIHQADLT